LKKDVVAVGVDVKPEYNRKAERGAEWKIDMSNECEEEGVVFVPAPPVVV
jgi:hypothetical protein